jgi:5'-3' exonuclease
MENPMTPIQALQLISEALEPRNLNAISRAGFCSIQAAIETLAAAIKQPEPSESNATND